MAQTAIERLHSLIDDAEKGEKWHFGYKPVHYKRCSVPEEKRDKLAELGLAVMGAVYEKEDLKLYYTQSLIAGAILSEQYDKFVIVTPSQYGKSFLLGHIGLVMAYMGEPTIIGASSTPLTQIIMNYVISSIQYANHEIQMELEDVDLTKFERLQKSLSRKRISTIHGGYVETVSLGEGYGDISHNQALGRGANYILDEAALLSEDTIGELGRRDFARIDGKKYKLIMISNPHKPGYFYDALTEEHPDDRTFILWMDAKTAIEEGRFTAKQVFESDFGKIPQKIVCYELCELGYSAGGMFDVPEIDDKAECNTWFLGIDSAYRGKDNVSICLLGWHDSMLHVEEIVTMDKNPWIDGVTSVEILREVELLCGKYHVKRVCIDIGFGVWLAEGLMQDGVPAFGINFGSGATKERVRANEYSAVYAMNKRAEMHLDLQDLIANKRITFTSDAYSMVKQEMMLVSSEMKPSGKYQIIPKIEIKNMLGKSPDELDSVLLAVHAAITYMGANVDYITE